MEEKKSAENSKRRQVREPPSVPFLWEVQPGIPIKNWKPEVSPVIQVPAPPVKLIASVPFIWEEKPGKPLPCFTEQQVESVSPIHTSKAYLSNITPAYSFPWDKSDGDNDKEGSSDGVYDDGGYSYDKEWASQLDLDTLSWETDESF
ncbi:Hydroxyproline-rich glycoprotein family protein [Quillaja saponaria]|uniref:Hydroxyproline-rich glycoprotein family protein n=1 Tax=Quillaja saponaria TaxID=32244 RepID=A0AAD7Q683_QUISA|nr:Hydroxyproline-rich glycoprotein family protein [Quillaja saponaria]KAJ7975584.1 Hydroxyproline-rich glycoprotein family protein [Quillaja saponaria]